jgi:hypothetical protein
LYPLNTATVASGRISSKLVGHARLGGGGDDDTLSLAGTGFAVMVDSETFGAELRHVYLVTAGHVVLGTQPVYARFRLIGGSLRDQRIDNWVHHPRYDIAVARLQDDTEVDGIAVPIATFTDEA